MYVKPKRKVLENLSERMNCSARRIIVRLQSSEKEGTTSAGAPVVDILVSIRSRNRFEKSHKSGANTAAFARRLMSV
jgi:hypothetical protein